MLRSIALLAIGSLMLASAAPADITQRQRSEALANAAGGPGVWRVDQDGKALHVQSGMTCDSTPKVKLESLVLGDSVPLGSDVSCEFANPEISVALSLRAFRPRGKSDGEWFDIAVASIMQSHPDARSAGKPEFKNVKVEIRDPRGNKLDIQSATFAFGDKHTSIWLVAMRGWILQAQTTYPVSSAEGGNGIGTIFFSNAIDEVSEYPANQ